MTINISKLSVLFACLSFTTHVAAYDGWTRISEAEVKEQQWRNVDPAKFLRVQLDMDGDEKEDVAAIVVSRDLKMSAIRVCFGGENKRRPQCQIIAKSENVADVMGVEKIKPGCHSYTEDDSGRLSHGKKICGRNDILGYFKFGSAGSFFVYEIRNNTFERYWDSD